MDMILCLYFVFGGTGPSVSGKKKTDSKETNTQDARHTTHDTRRKAHDARNLKSQIFS